MHFTLLTNITGLFETKPQSLKNFPVAAIFRVFFSSFNAGSNSLSIHHHYNELTSLLVAVVPSYTRGICFVTTTRFFEQEGTLI